MKRNTTLYANGTSITQSFPFGIYVFAYVMCPDGKVRKTKRISTTADTFFTIPASVKYKGKTVTGHVWFHHDLIDVQTVMFSPYAYRKHANIFKED